MNVKLYSPPREDLSTIEQYLFNRGIPLEEIPTYLKYSIEDVESPLGLGEDVLKEAAAILLNAIRHNEKVIIVVDSDCDGITSSAILLNYLYYLFPAFVENNITYIFHEGKAHGLIDTIDQVEDYDIVILPDSGTNDAELHKRIVDKGGKVIVLDHHEQDIVSEYATIINNQCSDYKNKNLSGAGVVWQFCRYIDSLMHTEYADKLLDLVAMGNMADMMALTEPETKALIFEGFKIENIHNPFIFYTIEKNEFSFNKSDYVSGNHLAVSPIGAAFFMIPQLNALCRSGTMEEKEIIFKSLLIYRAFDIVPSTKRGHKLGETETIVTQAIRMITNVKNRQDREVVAGMEHLEEKMKDSDIMNHKVLLFLLEPGEIAAGIAGLCANKIMSKYQRCVMALTKDEEGDYRGSARGYAGSGLESFKDVVSVADGSLFAAGHAHAFGAGISKDKVAAFLDNIDNTLCNLPTEASYFVDYIWDSSAIDGQRILDISELNDYIGTGLNRSYVYIKNVKITEGNSFIMKEKHLKVSTPSGIDIILWDVAEQLDTLMNSVINVVCKCNKNTYQGNISPQLIAEAWEIQDIKPTTVEVWGF